MRLFSFLRDGSPRIGCHVGNRIIDLNAADPALPNEFAKLLALGPNALTQANSTAINANRAAETSMEAITYLPLIPRPPKIICIGRNYAAHAKEGGAEPPTYPEIFYRGATSLIAHNAPIIRPTRL